MILCTENGFNFECLNLIASFNSIKILYIDESRFPCQLEEFRIINFDIEEFNLLNGRNFLLYKEFGTYKMVTACDTVYLKRFTMSRNF